MSESDPLPDRPRLRGVEAFPAEVRPGERMIVLRDPRGISDKVIGLPPPVFALAAHFDGTRTIADVQAAWARRTGELLLAEQVVGLLRALDDCLFLDGPRFEAARRAQLEAFRAAPVRKAAHAGGAYPAERAELEAFIGELFTRPGGPGKLPSPPSAHPERSARDARSEWKGALTALIAPHIDPTRGNVAYAHAFDALARAGGADLYVIFGTAHQGGEDTWIFTRKHFETPLGTVETDRAFIDRLEGRLGGAPLDRAELSHRTEHSVEFEAVFLRYVEERLGRRTGPASPRIVPLVCNSLQPFVERGRSPSSDEANARFFRALRAEIAEEEARGRRVVLVAGADLAHIGPKFGDAAEADAATRARCEEKDRASLERALAPGEGAEGFFGAIAAEKDARNICGLSCIYAMLKTLEAEGKGPRAASGKLLSYGMAPDPVPGSFVSYCAAAYYG